MLAWLAQTDSPSSIHSERSRHHAHSHSRKVTRDIAALDFLQNISMRSEFTTTASSHPNEPGGVHHHHHHSNSGKDSPRKTRHENDNSSSSSATHHNASSSAMMESMQHGNESLAGRRLPGFDATIVHVPPLFRYRFATKYPAASAVVRRWEGMTAQQGLLGSRTYFSSGCGYPVATSTIIKVGHTRRLLGLYRCVLFLF